MQWEVGNIVYCPVSKKPFSMGADIPEFCKDRKELLHLLLVNQKEGLIPRSLLRNKLFQDMEEVIY